MILQPMKRIIFLLSIAIGIIVFLFVKRIDTQSIPVFAQTPGCTYNSGTTYPLGDTTNSTNASFNAHDPSTDFYDLQKFYYFITYPSDDLSVNSTFFQDAQADHNGYDLYPQLASIVGFIPSKVLNAYHVKHKTKNSPATGDDKPFQNSIVEVQTTPGQNIKVPMSGYNILYGFNPPKGQGNGPAGLLMWTNGTSFVFQIGRADNPRNIFIYVFDVCVDQSLVQAYAAADAAGRSQLPELTAGQVIAKAQSDRVRIGMRDNGVFVEGRTPYVWDTQYQKTGRSSYPIISPTEQAGSLNTAIPLGVIKIGWPNPKDPPQSVTASGGGGNISSAPISSPAPVVSQPKISPVTPTHFTFRAYKPDSYVPGSACDLQYPFCELNTYANANQVLLLCSSEQANSCRISAHFVKKSAQNNGLTRFDFQTENSVSQSDIDAIHCYKSESHVFCFR